MSFTNILPKAGSISAFSPISGADKERRKVNYRPLSYYLSDYLECRIVDEKTYDKTSLRVVGNWI